ncbi:ABC transporter permease subunit, partial [Clostridium perfringens]
AGGLLMMIPFIWMITSSFKPENEFTAVPPTLLPKEFTVKNYVDLFTKLDFIVYLKNTLIIVFWSFVGLFLNALAGYAFAKYEFPGNKKLFYLVLATMMIPGQVTMIPVYLLINAMGLTNTMAGIVLPGLVGAFGIFLFRQFMSTIPTDLIEASRLDGAGELRIFFQLIVPITKPVFAVQGILAFIGAWNSFL